ncbi:MAG TPA: MlaD family protein [Pseudonocardia sp.]
MTGSGVARNVNAGGQLVKLAIFAAIALLLMWILGSTLLNATNAPTRSYVAEFTDVTGLHEGDNVRVAGVRVGRVEDVELAATHADVTISVRSDQPVFENTRVLIRYQNLVGVRYVALVPGDGPARPLAEGAHIPASRTEPSFDLSALFNGFAPLFAVLQPAELNQLAGNLVQVLQGSGPEISPLLRQVATLTNTIADRDQVIGSVIDNLNAVLDQLATKGPQTDELITQGRRLVDGLNANTGPFFTALDKVRTFSGDAQDLLDDVRPDLRDTIRRGADAADVFNGQRDELKQVLTGAPPALAGLDRAMQYGSWVNFYLCEGTVTAPGTGTTLYGPTPQDTHTEVCR